MTCLVNGAQMERQLCDPSIDIIWLGGDIWTRVPDSTHITSSLDIVGHQARGHTRSQGPHTFMSWVGNRYWKHWKWGSWTWKFLPHPTAVQQWQLGNWVEPWCWGGSLGWGLYCFHPGHVQAWGMPKRAKISIRSPVGPTAATTKLKFIVNVTQVREMEKDSAKLKILPNRYPRQAKKDVSPLQISAKYVFQYLIRKLVYCIFYILKGYHLIYFTLKYTVCTNSQHLWFICMCVACFKLTCVIQFLNKIYVQHNSA